MFVDLTFVCRMGERGRDMKEKKGNASEFGGWLVCARLFCNGSRDFFHKQRLNASCTLLLNIGRHVLPPHKYGLKSFANMSEADKIKWWPKSEHVGG
jgi:hypothetical protein